MNYLAAAPEAVVGADEPAEMQDDVKVLIKTPAERERESSAWVSHHACLEHGLKHPRHSVFGIFRVFSEYFRALSALQLLEFDNMFDTYTYIPLDPVFMPTANNITVREGGRVKLPCSIQHLGTKRLVVDTHQMENALPAKSAIHVEMMLRVDEGVGVGGEGMGGSGEERGRWGREGGGRGRICSGAEDTDKERLQSTLKLIRTKWSWQGTVLGGALPRVRGYGQVMDWAPFLCTFLCWDSKGSRYPLA
ncbi:hypothetical protein BaRGS_00031080 [Batillaria attramentaria]|uniref:Uncharacterized protein n=1 Tax=Batillaria attramentaria TaxID=370345 RepID=A0ABD0JRH4_9CAEN